MLAPDAIELSVPEELPGEVLAGAKSRSSSRSLRAVPPLKSRLAARRTAFQVPGICILWKQVFLIRRPTLRAG